MNIKIKIPKGAILCIALFASILVNTSLQAASPGNDAYSTKLLIERLNELDLEVDVRLTKKVKKYIKDYTLLARRSSEISLGKATLYFPVFEELNNSFGLPDEVKYLMVIESTLDPKIKSRSGARGLWQLMPATARGHGLQINDYVDERCDPYRSTSAALQHLSELYEEFGNWTIAIAAYNCGNGRMRAAIKKGKSKNFWKIKSHLPKETQTYVEKFIAAAYMMEYYSFYDMRPDYPDYTEQYTEAMLTYDYGKLSEISEKEDVDLGLLKVLNPSYNMDIIPVSRAGNIIILPSLNRSATKRTASLLSPLALDKR
jgi:membrane-bound lytic murein transglycosylase D